MEKMYLANGVTVEFEGGMLKLSANEDLPHKDTIYLDLNAVQNLLEVAAWVWNLSVTVHQL